MSLWDAVLLGLVQGLTEFLPISSSGHLVLFQYLMGYREPMLFFDIAVHMGTLISILIYFADDLIKILEDSLRFCKNLTRGKSAAESAREALHVKWAFGIIVATIPAVLAGFFLYDWFESLFGSLRVVGIAFLITSAILWVAHGNQNGNKRIEAGTLLDFLIVGLFQAVAITPGISRSALTIGSGLLVGFEKSQAFRLAFLMAIPAILGAALLKAGKVEWGLISPHEWTSVILGVVVAGFSGYASLRITSSAVQRGKLNWFAAYMIFAGFVTVVLSFKGF